MTCCNIRFMTNITKHREVFQALRAEITAGKYAEEGRVPSETQLVRRYGVSRPTVARALRDLQAAGLVERRAGSGTYVRSVAAAAASGSGLIGLLVPGMGVTEIFDIICGELAGLARVGDYSIVWGGPVAAEALKTATPKLAEEMCQTLIDRKVRGVFFAPFEWLSGQDQINRAIAEQLRRAGIPVVLLDRDVAPFPARSDFDLVGLDNFGAAYALTAHLLKMGCKRFRFVARPFSAPTVDARYAGFREALSQHGLAVEPGPYPAADPADVKVVRAWLTAKPEALVCANDFTAGVLMRTLETLGRHVPRDVRVAGFDDVKYATLLRVPLTTMHQPCRDIAVVAWRTMQDRIADPTLPPRDVRLAAHLVVRESCGAYLPRR